MAVLKVGKTPFLVMAVSTLETSRIFFTASAAQSPKRLAWNRPCSDRGQMNPRVYSVQRQILPNFVLIGRHLGEWIWRPKILLQAHNRGQPFPSGHGYRLRFFSTDPPPPQ